METVKFWTRERPNRDLGKLKVSRKISIMSNKTTSRGWNRGAGDGKLGCLTLERGAGTKDTLVYPRYT